MRIKLISALFATVLLIPGLSFAQDFSKVEGALGSEELTRLKESDPVKLGYLQFKANDCYAVQDLSGVKDISGIDDVSALNELMVKTNGQPINATNFVTDNFNPLLYRLENEENMSYYRIGETGKILKIYSDKRCKELYQK